MSEWKGVSHTRLTRSTESLPLAAYKVLGVLRRVIPDGQRRKMSQAEIARRAEISRSTVAGAMRSLDGIYLARYFLGQGRGNGYEIEMLPLPERCPTRPLSAPDKRPESDLCDRSLTDGITEPETAKNKCTESDLSTLLVHAHEQQQQTTGPDSAADSAPEPAAQLAPETIAALESAGAHPKLIARVAANNPACTPHQVAATVAAAQAKPNAHTPPGLALECLANRQQVIVPRPRPEPSEPPPAGEKWRGGRVPYDASKTDWAALNRAQDAKRPRAPAETSEAELLADLDEALAEEAAAPPPVAAPGQDLAALIAEALALLDDAPPDTVERGRISYLIRQERRSPAQAAGTLRAERERRSRPKNRAQARRSTGGT
jgi:hypothetical protein